MPNCFCLLKMAFMESTLSQTLILLFNPFPNLSQNIFSPYLCILFFFNAVSSFASLGILIQWNGIDTHIIHMCTFTHTHTTYTFIALFLSIASNNDGSVFWAFIHLDSVYLIPTMCQDCAATEERIMNTSKPLLQLLEFITVQSSRKEKHESNNCSGECTVTFIQASFQKYLSCAVFLRAASIQK